MEPRLDPRVTELLCARLCHDLIGPVAAVNNGVELVTEFDDGMQGEAIALIGESARNASRRLQFYRAAFGSARDASGEPLSLEEARTRALECLAGERIEINWPDAALPSRAIPRIGIKLVLNMALLGTEVLRGAGRLEVGFAENAEAVGVEVAAVGENLALGEEFAAAITGTARIEDLTPRTVQAYYTWVLSQATGGGLAAREAPGRVTLVAGLTGGGSA